MGELLDAKQQDQWAFWNHTHAQIDVSARRQVQCRRFAKQTLAKHSLIWPFGGDRGPQAMLSVIVHRFLTLMYIDDQ